MGGGKTKNSAAEDPHEPASQEDAAQKHGKAVESVLHLFLRAVTLGDPKYDRGEGGEQQGSAEMCELQGSVSYVFFPIAM